jgi:hypothetical protein
VPEQLAQAVDTAVDKAHEAQAGEREDLKSTVKAA